MMLTKKDIEKLGGIFATKDDLANVRNEMLEKLEDTVFNLRNEMLTGQDKILKKIDDDISNLRNEMLTGQDKILKKLEDISLEQKMAYSQYKRHDEKLIDHETRIKAIEIRV